MTANEKYASSILTGICLSSIALFVAYILQLGDPVHRVLGFVALIPVTIYGVIVSRRRNENKLSRVSAVFVAFICSLAGAYALAWLRPRLYNTATTHYPHPTAYAYVVHGENILIVATICLYAILVVLALYEIAHRFILRKDTDATPRQNVPRS